MIPAVCALTSVRADRIRRSETFTFRTPLESADARRIEIERVVRFCAGTLGGASPLAAQRQAQLEI